MRLVLAVAVAFLLSGCGGPAPDPTAPVDEPLADAARKTKAFAHEGYLSHGTCLPSGPAQCVEPVDPSATLVVPADDSAEAVALWRGNVSVRATVSWTSILAGDQEELVFAVQPYVSCGERCRSSVGERVAVQGRTPLTLDVPALDLSGADGLAFSLQHDPSAAGPVVTNVHMDHAFRMDGNVTALD